MTPRSVPLIDPEQAKAAMAAMYRDHVKQPTSNGHRLRLTVRDETRRDEQNAHFHALISQIAEHIGGDLADEDDAKRILLSAFKIDTVRDPDLMDEWARLGDLRMGRGLRGETVLLGNQTRTLSVKLAAAFIHWLSSFAIEHGVVLRTPKSWGDGNGR